MTATTVRTIERRVGALDREWDMARCLELTFATLALAGISLGTRHSRALILPAVMLAFLAQHAARGWCPAVPLFRSLGVRTRQEIDAEKFRLLELFRPVNARRSPSH